ELVVVDKEIFKLVKKSAGHVLQALDVCVLVICLCDGDETIVADRLFAIDLFSLDDPNKPRAHRNAWECGFIHEKKDVDRIAVWSQGLRKEAKVVWECHSRRENSFEGEDILLVVVGKFVAAALWRFDNDLK